MSLIVPQYGKRTVASKSIEVNKKFFFVFEGNKTEFKYFTGLRNYSKEIGISELINIVPIQRDRRDTNSHAVHLLEECKAIIPKIQIDHDFDKLFLIIDRDCENLFEGQLEKVLNESQDLKINIGLSNPCFEFWLLCHLESIHDYCRSELHENPRINRSKRLLEDILSKEMGGYNKRNLTFIKFKSNVRRAVENSKHFSCDLPSLKSSLGTNVGLIIEEML